jgi:copper chaperone CopZ
MLFALPAMAENIVVNVKGMHCEACAESLRQTFTKKGKAESMTADLEGQKITITMPNDADISDDKIKELVEWAGYEVTGISR